MMVFATNNKHKLEEARAILGEQVEVLSLEDIGCHDDIAETATTLEGNSEIKARYIYEHYHVDCFADDTGLEVEALDGAPGVYTARYAGEQCTAKDNRAKMLAAMNGKTNRKAQFRTVVTIIIDGKEQQVEGVVRGEIATEERGEGGFGYDSIFIPDGYERTFAQLPAEVKNSISHRARAMQEMKKRL